MTSDNIVSMSREFWDECDAKEMIFLFRVPEIVVMGIFLFCTFASVLFRDYDPQLLPDIMSRRDGSFYVLANNSMNSYPIKLGGVYCLPHTLETCKGSKTIDICCAFLDDRNIVPYQQVNQISLISLSIILPCAILFLRTVCWRQINRRILKSSKVCNLYWFRCYWDAVIGLLASAVLQGLFCSYMKLLVGAPRPIYFALKLWSTAFPDYREDYRYNASQSFPSGHASLSMATLSFTALLLLNDAYSLIKDAGACSKVLMYLAICVFSISIWIGCTRVTDYWHFPVDVCAGWALGALFSGLSYVFQSGTAVDILRNIKIYLRQSQRAESVYTPLNSERGLLNPDGAALRQAGSLPSLLPAER